MINFITLRILDFFDFLYKKKILNFLKSLKLQNLDVVFDVGAHEGEMQFFFLKNFNVKKIISFEASEINFSQLKKNIELNKKRFFHSNILIENIALGKESEKKIFKQFIETSSSTFSNINTNSKYFKKKFQLLNKKRDNSFFEKKQIQLTPLNEYLENKKINKIDILKIDTEGYEFEILKGLKNQIKIIDIIFFEHHYDDMINKSYTFSDIHNLLKKNNFEKIFKSKMPFRKTFEYIYRNKVKI